MNIISIRLPMHQLKLLELESKKRKQAKSFLIREALSEYFSQKTRKSRIVGSFYALTKNACGCFEGPVDLSTNKNYFKRYGQ